MLTFFYAPISTGHAEGIKHEKFENTS
jgi:hypothetical protein